MKGSEQFYKECNIIMSIYKEQNLGTDRLTELQEPVQSDNAKTRTKQSGSKVLSIN